MVGTKKWGYWRNLYGVGLGNRGTLVAGLRRGEASLWLSKRGLIGRWVEALTEN